MRIISPKRLREFWEQYPRAKKELKNWLVAVKHATWKTPGDAKIAYGKRVDFVRVASGNTVAVFDITNNNYRLIASIHYDRSRLFVLRVMDHQEYDEDHWKDEL